MRRDGISRRQFMAYGGSLAGAILSHRGYAEKFKLARSYKLALSTTSLTNSIGKDGGRVPLLDVPKLVRTEFDLRAAFLLSTQFDRMDDGYVKQLHKSLQKAQVGLPALLVEDVGDLGGAELQFRLAALTSYKSWVDTSVKLECKVLRIQWKGHERTTLRTPKELTVFIDRSVKMVQQLCAFAAERDVSILIETLGGPSSDPDSLLELHEKVGAENLGVMPNFNKLVRGLDLVEALTKLAPVSKMYMASSRDFDELTGRSLGPDFAKAIALVHDTLGYRGYIGIEHTGTHYTEYEGANRAKECLMALMEA